jgi:multimeric flavodoxin WrbA
MTDTIDKKIKILALQGSPRPKRSNTEILLREFLKGTASQGAESEIIYLVDKNIKHCMGCYTCWIKTPGICKIDDDMKELIAKVNDSQVVVYVTPLYISNMSSLLKAFCDRTLPMLDYHYVKYGDMHIHPLRVPANRKMVLISTCGLPEVSQFEGLRAVFKKMEDNMQTKIAGEILVASSELLRDEAFREPVLKASYQAGVELIKDGNISRIIEEQIQKPLIPYDKMAARANKWFSDRLEKIHKE